jgi:hypothetical protein
MFIARIGFFLDGVVLHLSNSTVQNYPIQWLISSHVPLNLRKQKPPHLSRKSRRSPRSLRLPSPNLLAPSLSRQLQRSHRRRRFRRPAFAAGAPPRRPPPDRRRRSRTPPPSPRLARSRTPPRLTPTPRPHANRLRCLVPHANRRSTSTTAGFLLRGRC